MAANPTIKRALLSVSDKSGLIDFAKSLSDKGVELLSTGGTAKAIKDAGLPVIDVSDYTGFPEMMDGRVKTLHPIVHGGLLALRDNAEHVATMKEHDIGAIDLLCVNLYPFEATVASGADYETCVENIDIGGPAMIRSAAKNHPSVTVIVDAEDYGLVLEDMGTNSGATTLATRKKLAAKAYARTAAYDAAISNWFASELEDEAPTRRAFAGSLRESLRYGENPHQHASFYVTGDDRPGVASATQIQGKALSYNNINDTDAAFELVGEFDPKESPAVAIIKHANPCGVAKVQRSPRPISQRWPVIPPAPLVASSRSTAHSILKLLKRYPRSSPKSSSPLTRTRLQKSAWPRRRTCAFSLQVACQIQPAQASPTRT